MRWRCPRIGREKGLGGKFLAWVRIRRKPSKERRRMVVVMKRGAEGWKNSIIGFRS